MSKVDFIKIYPYFGVHGESIDSRKMHLSFYVSLFKIQHFREILVFQEFK